MDGGIVDLNGSFPPPSKFDHTVGYYPLEHNPLKFYTTLGGQSILEDVQAVLMGLL